MKNLAFIISLFSVMFFSCEPEDITPEENSDRQKLNGTWKCDEDSELFKALEGAYEVTLNLNGDQLNISNFYNLGGAAVATGEVDVYEIDLSEQSLPDDFVIQSGQGFISDDYEEIRWSYTILIDEKTGEVDNVSAVYTKL